MVLSGRPCTPASATRRPARRLRAELRRSPAHSWAPYVAIVRVLTPERLVYWELLDVRGSLELGAGCGHGALNRAANTSKSSRDSQKSITPHPSSIGPEA